MSYIVDDRFGNRIVDSNTCCANVSSYPELRQDVRDLEVVVLGMASMSLGPSSSTPRRSVAATAAAAASTAAAAASSVISSGVTAVWGGSSATAETPRRNPPLAAESQVAPIASILARGRDTVNRADNTLRRAAETRQQDAARRGIPVTHQRNRDEEELQASMRVVAETLYPAPMQPLQIEPNGVCAICHEQFESGDDLVKLVCDDEIGVQHCFHRDCLQGWGATYAAQGYTTYHCPICRHEHDISDLHTPAADEQQTRYGWVQRIRDGLGRMTGRGEWSEVVGGAMGVLAGEERQVYPQGHVYPQSSTTSFDPENGLSTAGSSAARSVASEESFDAERSFGLYAPDFHPESDDEDAGAAEPVRAAEPARAAGPVRLYTEEYLDQLSGPDLRALRKKHKDAKHLGPAKQHATIEDNKHDLMQITVDQAVN